MGVTAADVVAGFLFLSMIAMGDVMAETVSFDSYGPGALPPQWVCGVTGFGAVGMWTKADSVTAFDDFAFAQSKQTAK